MHHWLQTPLADVIMATFVFTLSCGDNRDHVLWQSPVDDLENLIHPNAVVLDTSRTADGEASLPIPK
ncbi:MAG: hypothetical protein JXA28_13800 [Bacteroidetes bacterium]|nr:hypothetical protein [Bacteroidota bacterium]